MVKMEEFPLGGVKYMKLVIVESPTKSKTIKKYLGNDFHVLSSFGHIRDLAITGEENLGVDVHNNFEPIYEVDKKKSAMIKKLKKETEVAEEVFLATDPDREGEAISWHLAEVLNLDVEETKRVEFHEITKRAVTEAFQSPRHIDMNLVKSQETRRILDRIIGFKLSTLLKKKISSPSAGRVQSVVLKLIVDKEEEIKNFKKEEYYLVNGIVNIDGVDVNIKLIDNEEKDVHFKTLEEAQTFIANLKNKIFTIEKVLNEEKYRYSKPVHITSTLQQDAYNLYRFDSKKTMRLAQKLYEGVDLGNGNVGLITYMRTDSVRISPLFINLAKKHIEEVYGNEYVGVAKTGNKTNGKNQVQDAHEGIRPTDITLTPESISDKLGKDEAKLYKLIYYRAMCSMMKEEVYNQVKVFLNCENNHFLAVGETTTFDGFTKAYNQIEKVKREDLGVEVKKESSVGMHKLTAKQSETKPPARYNEARLIQTMERLGIGRPSTYATIVDTLKVRDYVNVEKGSFIPTSQGMITTQKLQEYFDEIMNVEYTSQMETTLDEIASGHKEKVDALSDFYQLFEKEIEEAYKTMPIVKKELQTNGQLCPHCGKELVLRKGRYGSFYACSGYPNCKYILKEEIKEEEQRECPKCHEGHLVVRRSRYGSFYACSNYPKCDYIEKK